MNNYGSRIANSCSFDMGTLSSLDYLTSHFSFSFQHLIACLELFWTRYYSYLGPNIRFLKFRLLSMGLIKWPNSRELHYWHYYCFLKNPEVVWRKPANTHRRPRVRYPMSFDVYGNDALWWNCDDLSVEWKGGIKIGNTISFWAWFYGAK